MPYITRENRAHLAKGFLPHKPGELNYQISRLCDDYIESFGTSYAILNEVIGVLECAKQEFYRRILAPYEDKKLAENGDVYGPGQTDL